MKIKLLTALLLLFFNKNNCTDQESFLQGTKAYEQKEYQQAFDSFANIANKGVAAWYNMGNSSYKLGNYSQAIACWHCAQRGASAFEIDLIDANVQAAQSKLGVEKSTHASSKLDHFVSKYVNTFSLLFLQLLFLLCWFLLFYFIKKNNHGTKYRTLMLVLLLTFNVFFIFALILKYNDLQHKGVVMKENTSFFAGPNEQFHVIGTLPIAAKVAIVETQNQWCKVKHSHVCGWILSDSIAVL